MIDSIHLVIISNIFPITRHKKLKLLQFVHIAKAHMKDNEADFFHNFITVANSLKYSLPNKKDVAFPKVKHEYENLFYRNHLRSNLITEFNKPNHI